MANLPITPAEITGLCEKLNGLDLSEPQRTLLSAILKMVWDATAPDATPPDATTPDEPPEGGFDFDRCFEPDQAALIMSYHDATIASATTTTWSFPAGIGKGPSGISRSTMGISRGSNP